MVIKLPNIPIDEEANKKFRESVDEAMLLPTKTTDELEDMPDGDAWIIKDLIMKKSICVLAGDTGVFKTTFAMQIAKTLTEGEDFFIPRFSCKGGNVLFVNEENQEFIMKERAKKMKINENLYWLNWHGFNIGNSDMMAQLRATVRQKEIKLIILDPFRNVHDKDEDRADDISPLLKKLLEFCQEEDVSILLLHHLRKSQGGFQRRKGVIDDLRGSSSLANKLSSGFILTKQGDNGLVLWNVKNRFAPCNKPITFGVEYTDEAINFIYEGEYGTQETKINKLVIELEEYLKSIRKGEETSRKHIGEAFKDYDDRIIGRALKKVIEHPQYQKVRRGIYRFISEQQIVSDK